MSRRHKWIWLCRILIKIRFPFVAEKILKMPFVQHEHDFSLESDAFFNFVAMIMMELTPFSMVFLSVWTIAFPRPRDGRTNLG